jgi:cytochrome-b5 reductase
MMFSCTKRVFNKLALPLSLVSCGLFSTFCAASAFSPDEWRSFPISRITTLNYNTKKFEIKLPEDQDTMGMETASCIVVRGPSRENPEKLVVRPYTPITTNETKGHFDLLVKSYPQGNVSSYLHTLQVGDHVDIKGPFRKFSYVPNQYAKIGMIAGGTGITPMLQVIHEILENPEDQTEISLVFANTDEVDILLRNELDKLASLHHNFHVYYVLVHPPSSHWTEGVGYVSEAMIRRKCPSPSEDSQILVCGPPPMMEAISGNKAEDKSQGELKGLLKKIGFSESNVFKF